MAKAPAIIRKRSKSTGKLPFMGYRRENGRVGIRNHVIILPLDDLSNAAAEAVANNIKGTMALPHAYGRLQFGEDLALHFRTLIGTGASPNVAACVVIGIEPGWTGRVVEGIAKTGKPVQGFSIDNYFGNSFGVFTGDGVIPVKIRFDEFAARYIRERIWHHSQSLRELARGQVELRLQVADLHEVGHWALSWGEHAEVVAPAELRRSLRQSIEALGRIYRVER